MAKSNLFKTDIAFKKLATGKVHTRPDFSEFNEGQNTFTQLGSNTIFGETIPTTGLPTDYGNSDANKIVQFVSFSIEELPGTDFDANSFEDSADSNVEAQSVGIHAFFIKLLPDYVSKTNAATVTHDRVGQDAFINNGIITSSLRTQLVPSSFGTDFQLSLKKADGTAVSLATDAQDLYIDFATGIILRQDVPGSANTPTQGTGYLYVGKFTDEVSSFTLSGSGVLSGSEQIADDISGSFLLNTTDEFTGLLTLTGDLSASGNISGSSLHITTTESIKNIIRSDGGWRFVSGLGSSDEDVQYLDATNNLLQWRSNGDAKFQIKSQNSGLDQAYVHFNHVSGDVENFSVGTSQASGSFFIARDEGFDTNKDFTITGSNGFIGINEPNPTERLSVNGNISASGDVSATNVSASILRISDPEHAGQLTFSQDSDNSYRLTSNIGTIFDFGSANVITTSQRIDGTRGMIIKTHLSSDLIKFRDFDSNDIIIVDHSGSLTLGNASGHEPHVIINTDVTASGNISASGDIFASNIRAVGDVIAQRYIVSSSVSHITQSFSSGSTIFGDTSNDTHQFTGSLSITGSSVTSGRTPLVITADGEVQVADEDFITSGDIGAYELDISSSGDNDGITITNNEVLIISGAGGLDVTADTNTLTFTIGNGILSSSNQIADDISGSFLLNTTDEFTGLLTVIGDISASGDITASNGVFEGGVIRANTDSENYIKGALSFKGGAQAYRAATIARGGASIGTVSGDVGTNDLVISTNNRNNFFIFKGNTGAGGGALIISGGNSPASGSPSLDVRGPITSSTNISASGDITASGGNFSQVSGFISSEGANRVLTSDGDGTFTAESNFNFDGTTLSIQTETTNFTAASTGFKLIGNFTGSKNISASGHLFASLSLNDSNHKTVMYDTASGQLFFTGSYGGGGGGSTFTGFNLSGDSGVNQTITSGNTVEIAGGTNINTIAGSTDTVTVNLDSSIFLTGDGLFSSGSSLLWGASTLDATSGFRRDSGRAYTHVTPQFVRSKYAIVGTLVRQKNVLAEFPNNYLVYGPSGIFVNGGRDPDTDGPVRPDVAGGKDNIGIPVVQVVGDLEVRPTQSLEGGGNTPGIRIAAGDPSGSVDPGIFFYSRDNISNDSSSFFYSSASAEIRFDTGSNSIKFLAGSTTENLTEVLHISKSGANPRVGIGTSNPIKAFDFKEVRDDNRGGELLIRGSRSTKGAENNDEVGRINFAIDSSSFEKIDTSGSAAEIVAIVDDIDQTGVEGSLSLRVAGSKTSESIQRIKLIGNPNSPAIEFTGSAAFDTDVTIGDDLTVSDFALLNSARIGSTATDPGDGVLHVEDYGVFVGGLKVGSSEDPGANNLIVDGTTTLKGITNIGNATGDTLTVSGSLVNLPSVTNKSSVSTTDDILILEGDRVKKTPQTGLPYISIQDGVVPGSNSNELLMFSGSGGTKKVKVAPGVTHNATLGYVFSSAGTTSDIIAGNVIVTNLTALNGNITASGDISSSGTITAATLDAAAVSDTLAAAIVAEIDNDEIPVAKLAEDSISGVTLGGNLNNLTVDNATLQLNSGTTYNGSAARTISIKDGGVDSDALAADISVTSLTTTNITASGDISASGTIITNVVENLNVLSLGDIDGNAGGVRLVINQDGNVDLLNATDTQITGETILFANSANDNVGSNIRILGHITASGDISSSGTIIAATLDAAAVSDTLAAAIVAEIDNDEIPIAKLAEDAVTVTAGTGLSGGGSVTLGGSITINSDGLLSSSAQIASDISGSFTATSASLAERITDSTNSEALYIIDSTGGTDNVTNTPTNLTLDSVQFSSSLSTFTISASHAIIANADMRACISFHVGFDDPTGADRTKGEAFLERSTDSGATFNLVSGSNTFAYLRNGNNHDTDTATTSNIILPVSSGDRFRVRVRTQGSSLTTSTVAGASGFSIFDLLGGAQGPAGPSGSSAIPAGTVSSSAQIASDISGSFTAASSSFSTRVTANEIITAKTLVSSSAQIASDVSGSFTAVSASFSTRVTANDAKVSYTDAAVTSVINAAGVLSSSEQISADISGAFTATSAALAADIASAGDITGVTAGSGLSGGGSSGAVTVNVDYGSGTIITDAGAFNTGGTSAANDLLLVHHNDDGEAQKVGITAFMDEYKIVNRTGTPVDNDYAKFTDANTIEGRSFSEVKTDLSLGNVTNESKATMFTSPTFTGNVTASGNISASGTITGNSIVGTLATAAQTNITSVGTLGSLTLGGDIDMDGNTLNMNAGEIHAAASVKSLVFAATADQDLTIQADGNITFKIDDDNDETGQSFKFQNNNTEIANLDESGNLQLDGNVSASITSTGSFGHLMLNGGNFTSASLASAIAGGGGVDTTGTPADNQIAVFTDADTIEGTSKLTFSNSELLVHSTNTDNTGIEIFGGIFGVSQPYISPVGANSRMNFGDGTSGHIFDFGNNKIGFDSDSTNTFIQADTDDPENLEIHADNNIELNADNLVTMTTASIEHRLFDTGSTILASNGGAIGDIVKFGGTSTTAGKVYYLKPDGTWGEAQADAGATASGSLAIALGSNSTTNGMCLRGFIHPENDPSAGIGSPVFLSDAASGRMLATAPDTSGDIVRILGHQFGTDLIYFNPSPDFIEVS